MEYNYKWLSREDLLKEVNFFKKHKIALLREIDSNRLGIKTMYRAINALESKGLKDIEHLVELDLLLGKMNTYIGVAFLNTVEDHDLALKYITRLPSLFFKVHLNKLQIIKYLKIDSTTCQLIFIPSEIELLHELRVLDFSGCLLDRIPKEIGHLKHLEKLNLNGNLFPNLPKEIGELSELIELDICDNKMLKELPEEIGNLRSLEIMSVHDDSLQKLPESIKQLKSLRELNLEHNQLKKLPNALVKLPNLKILKIDHNPLRKISASFSKYLH